MAWTRGTGAVAALAIGAAVAGGGALAHTHDPLPPNPTPAQKAAWARHEHFEQFGASFRAIGGELAKPAPDMTAIKTKAATLNALATELPTWFPKGSGVEARPLSAAKANIWTDAAGFSAKAADLQGQVAKLNAAAAAGDLGAVKTQFGPTNAACKACHDTFRAEDKG